MTSLTLGGGWTFGLGGTFARRHDPLPSMALSDEDLVRAAVGGSHSAFARLVERHQQGLRAFLRRTCGDWALADDLAQETFLTAWARLGSLGASESLRAWLCGIGYRKALTRLRGDRRAQARDAAYQEIQVGPGGIAHEDRLALVQVMAELPVDQRACVALCLAQDFSHGEAAHALGLPLGTVKSHVVRGRARLLDRLGMAHDEP